MIRHSKLPNFWVGGGGGEKEREKGRGREGEIRKLKLHTCLWQFPELG